MSRCRRLSAVVLAAAVTAGCGSEGETPLRPQPSGAAVETAQGTATPYGSGPQQVWLLEPRAGPIESVVVYLHGLGAALPFEWHLAWMDHLLAAGSAVVFPRYQQGSTGDDFTAMPPDLEAGLQTGFAALGYGGEPVVAAGFSLGGALAFVYAAHAEEWGVPGPRAVYSVFPVDPALVDPALDLSALEDTRALLLVGDQDAVVGRQGADSLLEHLSGLPASLKELRLIRTSDELLADHEAPTFVDKEPVRETFWSPLDELIEEARAG